LGKTFYPPRPSAVLVDVQGHLVLDQGRRVVEGLVAGDKPLNDAASLIQNKVTLYVNENR